MTCSYQVAQSPTAESELAFPEGSEPKSARPSGRGDLAFTLVDTGTLVLLYSRALAKARPDPDFRYFSKSIARASSVNAT